MLKITGFSMFLGALAVVATVNLVFLPSAASPGTLTPISINADKEDLQLELPKRGMTSLVISNSAFKADDYSFIHLSVEQSDPDTIALIAWTTEETGHQTFQYPIESKTRGSLWIATRELAGWNGNISSVALLFVGSAGDTALVNEFTIYPSKLSYQLRAINSDWAGFVPWNRSAMNTNTGVTKVSTFYPVPVAASWFILSVVSYGLILLLRKKLQFEFRVIALIFLACWIALDLSWQRKLLYQVADSQRQFSGKDTTEKLTVGPDAELFSFATEAKRHVETQTSRVFVSTSDDYIGLRTAYYLYPFNTLYSFYGNDLPHSSYMRSGDYIALLRPSETRFYPGKNKLVTEHGGSLVVDTIFSDGSGTLLRIQ